MIYKADSLEKMQQFACEFVEKLHKDRQAIVVGLKGDLGSGKTTFAQDLASCLGLKEEVTSPTFIIQKSYLLPEGAKFQKFVHIDAYRLDAPEELAKLGFQELLKDKEVLVVIEWPERVQQILPKDTQYIEFRFVNETVREISYGD